MNYKENRCSRKTENRDAKVRINQPSDGFNTWKKKKQLKHKMNSKRKELSTKQLFVPI